MNIEARAATIIDLADQCVQCGLCLPHCPTYQDSAQEAESPRGRIVIAKALAGGRLDATDAAASIEHCLGCRACEAVCPARVEFGRILIDARERTRDARPRHWQSRALDWLLQRPRLLRSAMAALPLLRRWPGLAAQIPPRPLPLQAGSYAPLGSSRGRLRLFEGCIAQGFDADVHRAAIKLLNRLGWTVEIGGLPLCCGALSAHAGDRAGAERLGTRLREHLADDPPAALIGGATGCIETLARQCTDLPVHELMRFIGNDARYGDLRWRTPALRDIVLQQPCSERNVLRSGAITAQLLRALPGVRVIEAPPACCGAAGELRLSDPRRAQRLAAPLLQWLAAHPADALASSNIGCRLHLLLSAPPDLPTLRFVHPIEILADACL